MSQAVRLVNGRAWTQILPLRLPESLLITTTLLRLEEFPKQMNSHAIRCAHLMA